MKYFLFGSLLLTTLLSLRAQTPQCGADPGVFTADERKAALTFYSQERPSLAKDNQVDSVAITVHIVRSTITAGFNELTPAQIEAEIEKANRVYGGAGIAFFVCGSPRILQGETVYNFNNGAELNRLNYVPNTINIYFADEVQASADNQLCGYAQFPFQSDEESRYIMMRKSCSIDGATLIHEMGHFYGLFHTHETAFGREYVDGSNCTSAGDRICDTSADPNMGTPGFMTGCTYVGKATDPKGTAYTPPISNFMSYAPSVCQRFFTEEQKAVIRSIHTNQNAYLTGRCDFYPDFAIAPDIKELTIRSDEDITMNYKFDYVGIDQPYEVELKISLTDDPDLEGLLLYKEKVLITPGQNTLTRTFDLDFPITRGAGVYYLQAVLDSEFKVIERTERNNTARTVVTVDNSSLNNVLIFPNPADDELKLFFRDAKVSGDFNIRIFRYDGTLFLEQEGYKGQEEFFQLLDVSALNTGLYILTVDFEKTNAEYAFKFLKK